MDEISRNLESAKDLYNDVTFNTDKLFNEPAPEPVVAFALGGALSVIGILMWFRRVQIMKKEMAANNIILEGNPLIRAWISCAIDSDDSTYVIVSYGAASFLFLGGIQLDYEWTLLGMIIAYFTSASFETLRVLLAFGSANSLADVIVTSDLLASQLRNASTELRPSNVYEDMGRGRTIVVMVFITQCILIAFVCVDVFESSTVNCRDGSSDCPIGGTLGSWGFYVLGIFMACVFQLGPKTNFGQSEQNPAYWLQLLLATKQTGAKITWYDPIEDKTMEQLLTIGDRRIWARFIMSFLINGVGYHILVHALPIQVASQSSLTGVVFRAVGMMYLVDLDDTPGYKLTIVQKSEEEMKVEELKKAEAPEEAAAHVAMSPDEIGAHTEQILAEARAKLDALARGERPGSNRLASTRLLAAGALANAGEFEDGDVVVDARGLPFGAEGNKKKKAGLGAAAVAAASNADDGDDAGEATADC